MNNTIEKPALTIAQINSQIDRFVDLYVKGSEAFVQAGEILVELVDNDPHTYDYILRKFPTLNPTILNKLEQMGRKTLHPQLLFNNSAGYNKLQKLPYSLQERYIDEPIPLVVHTENGTDVLLVKAREMTKEQANQAFATGRIRTEGEQKAFLIQQESNAAKNVTPAMQTPWKIKGAKVEINGVLFTRKELAGILAQMD
jgi:hypothetical protein